MLKRFLDRILAPANEPAESPGRPRRVPLATCALLIEVARADEEFTDEERAHILAVAQARFGLSEQEAHELMAEAESVQEAAVDVFGMTRALDEGLQREDKIAILEEVWRIIYSDGSLSGREDYLAHRIQVMLGLNHPELIAAKMKVKEESGG